MTEGSEDPSAPGVRADVGPRTDTLRGGRTVRGELGWSSQRPLLTTRPREPVGRPPRKPGPKGRFHCRCLPSGDGPEGAISLVERFACFSNGQRGPPSWLAQSLRLQTLPPEGAKHCRPSPLPLVTGAPAMPHHGPCVHSASSAVFVSALCLGPCS